MARKSKSPHIRKHSNLKHMKWAIPVGVGLLAGAVPLGFGIYSLANPKEIVDLKLVNNLKEFENSIIDHFIRTEDGYIPNLDYINFISAGHSSKMDLTFRTEENGKYAKYENVIKQDTFKIHVNHLSSNASDYWISENSSNNRSLFNDGYSESLYDIFAIDIPAYLRNVSKRHTLPTNHTDLVTLKGQLPTEPVYPPLAEIDTTKIPPISVQLPIPPVFDVNNLIGQEPVLAISPLIKPAGLTTREDFIPSEQFPTYESYLVKLTVEDQTVLNIYNTAKAKQESDIAEYERRHALWSDRVKKEEEIYRTAMIQYLNDLEIFENQYHAQSEAVRRENERIDAINKPLLEAYQRQLDIYQGTYDNWISTLPIDDQIYLRAVQSQVLDLQEDVKSPFSFDKNLFGDLIYSQRGIYPITLMEDVSDVYINELQAISGTTGFTPKALEELFTEYFQGTLANIDPLSKIAEVPYFSGVSSDTEISFEYELSTHDINGNLVQGSLAIIPLSYSGSRNNREIPGHNNSYRMSYFLNKGGQ